MRHSLQLPHGIFSTKSTNTSDQICFTAGNQLKSTLFGTNFLRHYHHTGRKRSVGSPDVWRVLGIQSSWSALRSWVFAFTLNCWWSGALSGMGAKVVLWFPGLNLQFSDAANPYIRPKTTKHWCICRFTGCHKDHYEALQFQRKYIKNEATGTHFKTSSIGDAQYWPYAPGKMLFSK